MGRYHFQVLKEAQQLEMGDCPNQIASKIEGGRDGLYRTCTEEAFRTY